MSITTIPFVLFSGLALIIYHLLGRRAQNVWLLLVSYFFVATWDWQFALVLGAVTLFNFVLAHRLERGSGQAPALLWFGIGANLALLVFFRLADFFLPGLEALFGRLGFGMTPGVQILAPLGLSYLVLQNISYLVDVWRGQLKAGQDLLDFALYLAYFPKMIAGPIERARDFLPKLAQPRLVDRQGLARSVQLLGVGAVRKLLIADILSKMILSDVFVIPAKYTPPELLGWLLIYAFMLYNDFAGYTDIVRGISGLFGIDLSPNFRTPFFARNFTEFWNRWHITLSEWLRDYIYFPISRALIRRRHSPRGLANLVLPPLATMLVSGLWHGFSLHMLLWGGLHGLYLIADRAVSLGKAGVPARDRPLWRQGIGLALVFTFVTIAWVPFGWDLPAAFEFWGGLLAWSSFAVRYRRMVFVLPFLLGSLALDFFQHRGRDEFVFLRWPRLAQAACLALILLLIFVTTGGDLDQPFIYQAF